MNAGPELDALVAEKVMGHVWDEKRCRICGWPLKEMIRDGCTVDSCSLRPAPEKRADEPSPYSTDIAAAWQVVEKLRADGRAFILHDNSFDGKWQACFELRSDLDVFPRPFKAHLGDTAPVVICRAALAVAGVDA